jgi:A/G-specific adenine glycosylase
MATPKDIDTRRTARLTRFFREWHTSNGRAFPWRTHGTTAYALVLAEMLLRQTRAEMVVPVWSEVLIRYPDPASLAKADSSELFEFVGQLGFGHQRTAALIQMAVYIVRTNRGRIPRTLGALLEVPHLGVYSASAILCFAFQQRVPIVDVNVLRVLSRLYGEDLGADNRRAPEAWRLAWRILPPYKFRQHNLGLLDFSAQICTARTPKHEVCPLQKICSFYQAKEISRESSPKLVIDIVP